MWRGGHTPSVSLPVADNHQSRRANVSESKAQSEVEGHRPRPSTRSGRLLTVAAAVAVVGGGLALAAAASDGVETLGVSFHDRGRAGTDVAVGDTALSPLLNPASVANFDALQVDFATSHILPQIRWQGLLDEADSTVRHIPLAGIGVAGALGGGWHGGLAVNAKSGLLSEMQFRHLTIPWMRREVGADVKNVMLSANVARRFGARLTLGAGVNIEYVSARFSEVLGPVDLEFGRGDAFGIGFQVGARYELTPAVTIAAAYRTPTWFGDVAGGRGRASLGGVIPLDLGPIRKADFKLPQRASLGVAWRPNGRLLLSAETRYVHHSGTSLDAVELHAARLPGVALSLPLGYRNQWIFKIGGEYRLDERWVIGAGYSYATNPVDPAALRAIASVMTQHHVSIGLRYEAENWWAGIGYGFAFPHGMNSSGTRIPLGVDYAFSRVDHLQHEVFAGFGITLR